MSPDHQTTGQPTFVTTVPSGSITGGRALRPFLTATGIHIEVDEHDITPALVKELNLLHAYILGMGLWAPTGGGAPGRDQIGRTPSVLFRIAKPGELPAGLPCLPIEAPGSFVWLIREGEMSRRLAAELTDCGRGWLEHGDLVQNWGDRRQPVAS